MLLVLFGQNLVFDFANQQAVRLISKLNFSLKISALILQLMFDKWYYYVFTLFGQSPQQDRSRELL